MIQKKLFLSFALGLCMAFTMHAAKPKAITITPDHTLVDKIPTSYYTITFLPLTTGYLTHDSKSRPVKLPASKGQCGFGNQVCFELSYPFKKYTPIYFSDLGGKNMCAYADNNQNLDYTDDGAPVYADAQGKIKLHINPYSGKIAVDCIYEIMPARANTPENVARVSERFEEFYPDRKKLDPRYWIFCCPQIVKAQNIVIDQDSMTVVLTDGDCNGSYSGSRDQVALLPYGLDSATSRPGSGLHTIKEELILGYKGKAYEVIVDYGRPSIQLKPRPDLPPPPEVIVGKPLPHFNVTLLNDKSVDIYSLLTPGKPTYINFWSSENEFLEDGNKSVRELFNAKKDSINIVSFSLDAEISGTKKYVSDNNIVWPQCVSDENTEDLLYRNGQTPYAIIIDKNGIVYHIDSDCDFALMCLPALYK